MFQEAPRDNEYFIRRVECRPSPIHRLGVFATEDIPARFIMECSPVIIHYDAIYHEWHKLMEERHILHDYVFAWYDNQSRTPTGETAMALGYCGLYNNSYEAPNAQWKHRNGDYPALCIVAMRDIKAGEEILIRYHPNPDEYSHFVDNSKA